MTKQSSFFKQPDGQGSEQGEKNDDAQAKKVINVARCSSGAVLGLYPRSTTSDINDRMDAALAYAVSKIEKSTQPHIKQSMSTGVEDVPPECAPRYIAIKEKENETRAQTTAREERQEDRDYEEVIRARQKKDEYIAQTMLGYQLLKTVLTPDAEQAMRDRGSRWVDMERATGMDRIFKFTKLYKEVANPTKTKSGVSTLNAVQLLKQALSINPDETGATSIAQIGEEVRQSCEAAANAGVYVSIESLEKTYMKKNKITTDKPTSDERAEGFTRASATQRTAMRAQLQKETGALVLMTTFRPYGQEGSFVQSVNNQYNITGDNPIEGKNIPGIVGMASRHSGTKSKPTPTAKQGDNGDGGKEESNTSKLCFASMGKEDETKERKSICISSDDVSRLAPDDKGRLWFDHTGKPFTCKNQKCKDAKKDLGHGGKLCPNKEDKENKEESTTSSGLAMATVASNQQAIQRVLFGADSGITLATFGGRKAGVGPAAAVSATIAPPAGPQECVGHQDATGLGKASKPFPSPFA